MPVARSSTSTTCTVAVTGGGTAPSRTPRTSTPTPGWTSTRRPSTRRPTASTHSRSGPVSPTTSRSRAAPVASSTRSVTCCSTATSPSTTSLACGASGASTTPCSLSRWGRTPSLCCPTASPPPRPSTRRICSAAPWRTAPSWTPRRSSTTGYVRSCRRPASAAPTPRTRRYGTGRSTTATPPSRSTSASPKTRRHLCSSRTCARS